MYSGVMSSAAVEEVGVDVLKIRWLCIKSFLSFATRSLCEGQRRTNNVLVLARWHKAKTPEWCFAYQSSVRMNVKNGFRKRCYYTEWIYHDELV